MAENWQSVGVYDKSQLEAVIQSNIVRLRQTGQGKHCVTKYYGCKNQITQKCKFRLKIREDLDSPDELEVWKKGRHEHSLENVRYQKLSPGQQRAIEAAVVTERGATAVRNLLKNYKEQPMSNKRISNALQLEKKRQKEGKPRREARNETTATSAPGVSGILFPMTASQSAEDLDASPTPATTQNTPKLSDFMIPNGAEAKIFDVDESGRMRKLKEDLVICEIEKTKADTEKVKADTEKIKMDWERSRIGVEILKLQKEKLEIELERLRRPRNDRDLSTERGSIQEKEPIICQDELDGKNI